ncbi:MAG: nucleotidyltransferase family protein, partial [Lachnoanaerobaculum saburreum]
NELANTIKQNINEIKSKSFEDFILSLKSKNFTYTRISRAIFHILLNHKKKELKEIKMESDIAAYPVLLGFKKSAVRLLSELKLRSRKPVISKMSSAKKLLSEISLKIFENNIYCDFLYNSIYFEKYGKNPYNPYRRRMVIL